MSYATRPIKRAFVVAGLAMFGALSSVGVATAGEYRYFACTKPDGKAASMVDWKLGFNELKPGVDECGTLSSSHFQIQEGAESSSLAWTGTGLTLPDGVSAKLMTAQRRLWITDPDQVDGDVGARPAYAFRYGPRSERLNSSTAYAEEWCYFAGGCRGFGWAGKTEGSSQLRVAFPPDTGFVGFTVGCRGEWGPTCGAGRLGRAHLRIDAVDMTLIDDRSPVVSSLSGSLVQDGVAAGHETVSFAATDVGAGVYNAYVVIDGSTYANSIPDSNPSCADAGVIAGSDLEFDRVQPCSLSLSAQFNVDTTKVDDGRHRLDVFTRDASGNWSNKLSRDFVVDNLPPPAVVTRPAITGEALATGLRPGDAIVATNGTWQGPGLSFKQRWQRSVSGGWTDVANAAGGTYRVGADDIDRQLRVVVTATNGQGSTESASEPTPVVKSGKTIEVQSVAPGQPGTTGTPGPSGSPGPTVVVTPPTSGNGNGNGGGGNPSTGQLVVDREQRTVDVKHSAKIVITGRLVDADSNPIANATVDVFEQLAVTAAPWIEVDTVKTDAQGGYVYRPKTTASRRLRFAYSDRRETADYRATREVFVSVTAGMTIKAKNRVVPRRSLIRLSGKVVVDHLPKAGSWVEVQVLDAGVWRTIATRRLSETGGWSFKHRLRASARITFAFRARLRTAGDLPSAEAKSSPVKVRVK